MKSIILPTTLALASNSANAVLGLRNYHLLSGEDKITPFESIAYIETYDEVPIFGGQELRQKMLNQAKQVKSKMFGLEIASVPSQI